MPKRRNCDYREEYLMNQQKVCARMWVSLLLLIASPAVAATFEGQFYRGEGDDEYLQLLDVSRRMFAPDPEFQNLPMLYLPTWNGFVEGPTWGAWWIQNSYGPTYCALPVLQEPLVTFLQNAQDLWFTQMGDGKRAGANNWVAPDGCLCDAASPNWIYYKQGDGRIDIHDWGVEFTAAGLLMQAELLLISRDEAAIKHYLPLLERCANFIETRRDPEKNLFLAGPAGNLLAPSYAGWRRPDGSYGQAYLAGLSITYIAALDRLIELERLAGATEQVPRYTERRDAARRGLANVTTDEGYFLKSLDPDGTRHGVYGADKHGYFEAVCNHDAICFRVAEDEQARKIMDKLRSIPGLRPHDLIVTNSPSLDDMYEPAHGLWQFGTWVNGGHWTTCEARMMMAYARLGCFEDSRRAMRQIMKFARVFRLDNPLVAFGDAVYQPGEPINLCYDSFGAPAALVRGLFEYLYRAEGLTLVPHIPPGITRLEQHFPVRFGRKQLYLATVGAGPVSAVTVNGKPWAGFDAQKVDLPYADTPDEAVIVIALGQAAPIDFTPRKPPLKDLPPAPPADAGTWSPDLFPVISTNDLPLRIGADSDGNNRFVGLMARARVFGRALTAEEIAAAAPNKPGPLDQDPALIGDWRLDERRGGVVPNARGDFLPAQVVGELQPVDGPDGKVLQFAGKGYLEVAPDPRLNLTSDLTLEAWLRPDQLAPGGARILDKSRVGTSNGYLLDTHPGMSLRLIVERGVLSHGAQLPTDKWTHVAATVNAAGQLALYIGGRQVAAARHASPAEAATLSDRIARLRRFHAALAAAGLGDSYEAAHARLAVACHAATFQRFQLLAAGKLARLPPASQYAADKSYFVTTSRLCEGLEKTLAGYEKSESPTKRQLFAWFQESAAE